jgi:hypothetical protein
MEKLKFHKNIMAPHMNTTQRPLIMQCWKILQYDLMPKLR